MSETTHGNAAAKRIDQAQQEQGVLHKCVVLAWEDGRVRQRPYPANVDTRSRCVSARIAVSRRRVGRLPKARRTLEDWGMTSCAPAAASGR